MDERGDRRRFDVRPGRSGRAEMPPISPSQPDDRAGVPPARVRSQAAGRRSRAYPAHAGPGAHPTQVRPTPGGRR